MGNHLYGTFLLVNSLNLWHKYQPAVYGPQPFPSGCTQYGIVQVFLNNRKIFQQKVKIISKPVLKHRFPIFFLLQVINSVKKTWGTVEKYNVRPRDRGTLVSFEQSNTYQRASKACLDKNIELGTWEAFKCSWIIDFGFAGLFESQGALDLGICTVSGGYYHIIQYYCID